MDCPFCDKKLTEGKLICPHCRSPVMDFNYIENENGLITITCNPSDIHKVKDIVEKIIPNVDYIYDEVGMYPKDYVTLEGEDKEVFDKLYNMLDEIDDVTAIYTNVK